jgi:hypothetical protein
MGYDSRRIQAPVSSMLSRATPRHRAHFQTFPVGHNFRELEQRGDVIAGIPMSQVGGEIWIL